MIGGSTNSSTNSGASLTFGSPGNSASITPASTSKIAGGSLSRSATSATPAITTSNTTKIWIVGIIGALGSIGPRSPQWYLPQHARFNGRGGNDSSHHRTGDSCTRNVLAGQVE